MRNTRLVTTTDLLLRENVSTENNVRCWTLECAKCLIFHFPSDFHFNRENWKNIFKKKDKFTVKTFSFPKFVQFLFLLVIFLITVCSRKIISRKNKNKFHKLQYNLNENKLKTWNFFIHYEKCKPFCRFSNYKYLRLFCILIFFSSLFLFGVICYKKRLKIWYEIHCTLNYSWVESNDFLISILSLNVDKKHKNHGI